MSAAGRTGRAASKEGVRVWKNFHTVWTHRRHDDSVYRRLFSLGERFGDIACAVDKLSRQYGLSDRSVLPREIAMMIRCTVGSASPISFSRSLCPLAAAIGAPLMAGSAAMAQTYPSQLIKVICSVASGSAIDVTARLVTNDLSNRLGKPVIVENRPGGGGTIGVGEFTRAAPDGHTLLCGAIGDAFASIGRWSRPGQRLHSGGDGCAHRLGSCREARDCQQPRWAN